MYTAPAVNRIECVDAFARLRGDAVVVVGPGYAGHELYAAKHDEATIYNMDMPCSSPLCLGLALACPNQRVVAFEGDGSMLMALGTLATEAALRNVATEAGFTRFRRAMDTPFNRLFEARP